MIKSVLQYIVKSKKIGKKLLAVLLDPDKVNLEDLPGLSKKINQNADFIFVGGSTFVVAEIL